ncbi:VOC family protein [Fredinandcohnia humi]
MNPLLQQIGTVFIPVKDIEKARDWYCDLLGISDPIEVLFGHICTLPLEGVNLVLDSKIYSPDSIYQVPAFHLNTHDIEEAYQYCKSKEVELVTEIMHGHWFTVKDPNGNHIMICKC